MLMKPQLLRKRNGGAFLSPKLDIQYEQIHCVVLRLFGGILCGLRCDNLNIETLL